MSQPAKQDLHRLSLGIVLVLATSFAGLILSVYASVKKFQLDVYLCHPGRGCAVGSLDCREALSSDISVVLGLPLSLWSAAFYTSALVVALGLLRRRQTFLHGYAPLVLLSLGIVSVLVSIGLAAYSLMNLTVLCPICLGLYSVSGLFIVGAIVLIRTDGRGRKRGSLSWINALLAVGAVFLSAAGVHAMAYSVARQRADPARGCPPPNPLENIPPASVIYGAGDDAEVLLALFIDPSCGHCRDEFGKLVRALERGDLQRRIQLQLYHFPRDSGGCSNELDSEALGNFKQDATANLACQASRAVECAEEIARGSGVRMMEAVLDLQTTSSPWFTHSKLSQAAQSLGLGIDPSVRDNTLVACMDGNVEVQRRIRSHLQFARNYPIEETPAAFLFQVVDKRPDLKRVQSMPGFTVAKLPGILDRFLGTKQGSTI